MDKASRLLGKFHYTKNVWRYRYRLHYGGTYVSSCAPRHGSSALPYVRAWSIEPRFRRFGLLVVRRPIASGISGE